MWDASPVGWQGEAWIWNMMRLIGLDHNSLALGTFSSPEAKLSNSRELLHRYCSKLLGHKVLVMLEHQQDEESIDPVACFRVHARQAQVDQPSMQVDLNQVTPSGKSVPRFLAGLQQVPSYAPPDNATKLILLKKQIYNLYRLNKMKFLNLQ